MTSHIDIPDISDPHVMALSARSAVQSYTKTKKMSKKQGLKWNGNAVVDILNIYEKYEILWDTTNENYF